MSRACHDEERHGDIRPLVRPGRVVMLEHTGDHDPMTPSAPERWIPTWTSRLLLLATLVGLLLSASPSRAQAPLTMIVSSATVQRSWSFGGES